VSKEAREKKKYTTKIYIIFTLHECYYDDISKEDEMGEICSKHGDTRIRITF
jgi:hypothetical protein